MKCNNLRIFMLLDVNCITYLHQNACASRFCCNPQYVYVGDTGAIVSLWAIFPPVPPFPDIN